MDIVDALAGILMLWGLIWGIFIPAFLLLVIVGFILIIFSYMFLND